MIAPLSRSLWLWGVVALIAATLAISGYVVGHRHAANACAAEKLRAVQRAIMQAEELQREDAEVLRSDIAMQERVRTEFRIITREVVRYVEAHPDRRECLDADGLRIWNAANAGAAPSAAGGVRAGMPGVATGTKRQ